jgi:NAD(P)-dependent dehydrogenase (short-subunit alcohol dehydrogenase family)
VDLGLRGKVALVTGVSYGIGAATADAFIVEGAQVLGTNRTAPTPRDDLVHASLDMSNPDAGTEAVAACPHRGHGVRGPSRSPARPSRSTVASHPLREADAQHGGSASPSRKLALPSPTRAATSP